GVAGVEDERGVGALEAGGGFFQRAMGREVSGDQPRRTRAGEVLFERGLERRHQLRVGGEPEVVVGAEVDQPLLAVDDDLGAVARGERLERAQEPARFQRAQVLFRPGGGQVARHSCGGWTLGSSGAMPAFFSSAMSSSKSGLPVVSSLSPKK